MQASKHCWGEVSAVLTFCGRVCKRETSAAQPHRVGKKSGSQAGSDRSGAGGTAVRWIVSVLVGCGVFFLEHRLHAGEASDYQIKAAFLYQFTQFVEWPEATFSDQHAPVIIGVLGLVPFGPALDELAGAEKVAGRPLTIERYGAVGEIDRAHLVFISRSEQPGLEAVLQSLENRPILTTSDIEGFIELGGMVGFVTQNNRVRYEVNLKTARQAGLTLSSQLLRLAVKGHGPG